MNQTTQERKKYAAGRMPRTSKRMRRRPRLHSAPADDLNHRQTALADLLAEARALVPDPPDSPTRRACRESPLDEGIGEKFRRQGFHL